MRDSNSEIRTEDEDVPFTVVSLKTERQLNDKQLFDFQSKQHKFVNWLLTFGKNPDEVKGYAEETIKRSMKRTDKWHRWVWQQEDEYVPTPSRDHAINYIKELAYDNYSASHKSKCQVALKRYFKWRHHEFGEELWDPELTFTTDNSNQPRDYLTLEERKAIREAALEYSDMKWYQSYSPEQRTRLKPYIAERVDKPTDCVTREDWNGLTSWKYTSVVWTSLDAGLRPIEVQRAPVSWIDVDNAILRIPVEESSKNKENWTVSLRDDTAEALERWLHEREFLQEYDDTDALWLTEKGTRFGSTSLKRLLLKLCDRAGIDYSDRKMSWYSIRHSVGTWMSREEGLAAAQAQLRHQTPETTMKYDAAPPEDRRDALDRIG